MNPLPAAITVDGLTRVFGGTTAVSSLSFSVPTGSVTGFIGPNGSGKTTTLRMILGLTTPTSGVSYLHGTPFRRLDSPGTVVGAALDGHRLNGNRTALNHLRVYTAAIGVDDARCDEVLSLVGLAEVAGRKIRDFSLGMRQRLILATAMLGSPSILILDEPTNGLDPEGIAWFRTFLQRFAREGGAVLVSSHHLRELQATIDRVVVISEGTMRFAGSMDELGHMAGESGQVDITCADPQRLASYLVSSGVRAEGLADGRVRAHGLDPQHLTAISADSGVAIFGHTGAAVDLEQIYITLTGPQFRSAPNGAHQGGLR